MGKKWKKQAKTKMMDPDFILDNDNDNDNDFFFFGGGGGLFLAVLIISSVLFARLIFNFFLD